MIGLSIFLIFFLFIQKSLIDMKICALLFRSLPQGSKDELFVWVSYILFY